MASIEYKYSIEHRGTFETRVNPLGSYWYPPGPNVEPKGHHWIKSYIFSKLVKNMVIGIYWRALIVSAWGLLWKSESVLVGCQANIGMTWVVVIQEKFTKNVPHWVKMGALWNYHCQDCFLWGVVGCSSNLVPQNDIQT